ncbi:MAG: hypothetical protein B9S26_08430 [Opitutia bacterium Tous-C4FEB]|nr:MAG: hypothetical protein B9S35_05010 [Opitutae bacterium Tous-C5TDCM]PAW89460.1 MAG: hypothetical protein B9S26_08430 [Opitutae bacterium Tous-C4FEB]
MSKDSETPPPPGGQFLVYQTEDGKLQIDVRFEGETVWLTQQHMAELFQTTKQNVGQHLKSIFAEGELVQDSVVKDSFTTAADGKNYLTRFYNLDAIISVGYRVKSAVATRFRIWATQQLREYIVKGFLLDDERLKNPDEPFDYFEELMRQARGWSAGSSTPFFSWSKTRVGGRRWGNRRCRGYGDFGALSSASVLAGLMRLTRPLSSAPARMRALAFSGVSVGSSAKSLPARLAT